VTVNDIGEISDQCQVNATSSVMAMVSQILACAVETDKTKRFNPRPPGVAQPGGATEAVWNVLVETGAAMTESQLVWRTKKSRSAVTWALIRLKAWKKIDVLSDSPRNSRYCRYRAKREKQA